MIRTSLGIFAFLWPAAVLSAQGQAECKPLASSSVMAWEPAAEPGVVFGRVVRNYRGSPARAEIMLLPDSVDVERAKLMRVSPRDVPFAFADSAGKFRLARVAAGSYVVRIREIGMQTVTSRVVVSEWGAELTVVLVQDVNHRSTCGLVKPPAT